MASTSSYLGYRAVRTFSGYDFMFLLKTDRFFLQKQYKIGTSEETGIILKKHLTCSVLIKYLFL